MSNLNIIPLGDIAKFKYGKILKKNEILEYGLYPVFSGYQVVGYLDSYEFKDEQLIIVCRGAGGTGDVKMSPKNCSITNLAIIINIDEEKFDKKYIYWVLKKSDTYSLRTGSAQPQITINSLEKFPICVIYNIETQKRIVNILDSLDKKIQLNTQINQALEQIAQAIFKSWFVDFDPVRAKAAALGGGKTQAEAELAAMQAISGKTSEELAQMPSESYAELAEIAKAFPSEFGEDGVPMGWGQTTLSEICEMQNGYAFKSSDWTESGTPVIKIGSVKPMIVEVEGNGFVSDEYQKLKPDFLLTDGDILVGLTGYVGEVGRIPQGKMAMLNQRVAKFIPKVIEENCSFYNYVYCLARQPQFKEFAEMNAKGSAQANISTKELLKFPIIKADNKLHILFENKIKSILEKILVNSQNSEDLARVRDLLLPKLLNGEIQL